MRLSYLSYTLSLIIMYFSAVLLVPIIVALAYGEFNTILPFVTASASAILTAVIIRKLFKSSENIKSINDIKKSEGLCSVTFSWIFACLFTAIPYLFFGLSPIDAFFEGTSGITTTGATVFTTFQYPHALLFWRSFSQWLGGMGIIVLFIAVLPQFAIAGRQLFFAEAPGPTEEKFTPRIKSTASALWKIYAGLTVIEILFLKYFGMNWFNAICNSLSSISGGGFSPMANSFIGSSHTIMWIITFFMFFAGANFNLQYKVWTKFNPLLLFKNEEFKIYFGMVVLISLLLSVSLFLNMHYSFCDSISHAFFNVSSLVSSTGFCSVDYAKWDYVSKVLLVVIMLFGSSASSAGGGLKVMRWMLIFKIMKSEMTRILHPKAVYNIKIGNYSVSKDILYQTLMFVSFYFALIGLSALFIAIIEKNTIVAVIGSIASVGNIGPGLGQIGPMGHFANLHAITKFILILDMIAGRLELIPFLVLFQKDLWLIRK